MYCRYLFLKKYLAQGACLLTPPPTRTVAIVPTMAEATKHGDSQISEKNIPEWASGTNLRHVEQDVLIPKIIREEAKVLCKEYVDAFTKCAKGRTVSMITACREENKKMKKCLGDWYFNDELRAKCTQVYLERRKEYQENYANTNETAKMKRKESTMNVG